MNIHAHPIGQQNGIYCVSMKTELATKNQPEYVSERMEYKNQRWVDIEHNYPHYYIFAVNRKIDIKD